MFNMLSNVLGGRVRKIISVIVMLAAVGMFVGAVVATVINLNLHINGVKTNATILNVQTHKSTTSRSHTSYTYTDIVEFTTPDGARHQESIAGAGGQHVGDTIDVVYDPSDPGTVQDASSVGALWWVTSVMLLLFALVFGWLGRRIWRSGRQAR